MPELPEVETVVQGIRPHLEGRTITKVHVNWPKALIPASARQSLVGRSIKTVSRRAKFIVLDLDEGALLVHLRMTGRLYLHAPDPAHVNYVTVALSLDDESRLTFQDTRKFGRFVLVDDAAVALEHLGPEPLSGAFSAKQFTAMLRTRKRQIKPLLLDQGFLAGLGNIYVDEALFVSGIHPLSIANQIPEDRIVRLHRSIRRILRESIERQGTTVLTFVHGDNRSGEYQHKLKVYGRKGEACVKCKNPIHKIVVGQRGTHFCAVCQPVF
jgi:formamidopyrimidine-DNA glycosylase